MKRWIQTNDGGLFTSQRISGAPLAEPDRWETWVQFNKICGPGHVEKGHIQIGSGCANTKIKPITYSCRILRFGHSTHGCVFSDALALAGMPYNGASDCRNTWVRIVSASSPMQNPDTQIPTASAQGRNREKRIADILSTAKQIFVEDGYAAFATRRVAARLGITLSNLQYYFPSKETLLLEVIGNELQGCMDGYRTAAHRPHTSARSRCSALVEYIFADMESDEFCAFFFELWAFCQHEPSVLKIVQATYAQYLQLFEGLIREINPTLTSQQSAARASVIAAQAEGIVIFATRSGDSRKAFAEIAKVMKRNLRVLAGLSTETGVNTDLLDNHPLLEDVGLQSPAMPNAALSGQVFGSERHLLQGRQQMTHLREQSIGLSQVAPTKQSARREEKINSILSSAANVLATEGYGNFTQARVAKLAGILQSGLQHYFPTHDDLLRSTVGALLWTYQKRYEQMALPNDKPAIERLIEITGDATVESCDIRACRFSFELFALAQHSDVTSDLVVNIYAAYREVFVTLMREIDPGASKRECFARATVIVAQIEGFMMLSAMSGRRPSEDAALMALVKANTVQIALGQRA